jgi:hypothetical protein
MKILLRGCFALTVLLTNAPLIWSAPNRAYRAPNKPFKASVHVLAITSSVHQNFAGNQDTYVAEITSKSMPAKLAVLIDRYPGYGDTIRRAVLSQRLGLQMRLIRSEACDTPARYVSAPQRAEDIFDERVQSGVEASGSGVLPCFLIDHAATRIDVAQKDTK